MIQNKRMCRTTLNHLYQVYDQLEFSAPYFFESTSLHVFPQNRELLQEWFYGLEHTYSYSYLNNNQEVKVILLITFVHQMREAKASIVIPRYESKERSLYAHVIQDIAEFSFFKESMQRITIYNSQYDRELANLLQDHNYTKDGSFGEAYWYNGRFTDIEIYSKLK